MTDDALTADLRRALEELIVEAKAKGPGRVLTAAERDALLWVTDREEAPRDADHDRPAWWQDLRLRVQ